MVDKLKLCIFDAILQHLLSINLVRRAQVAIKYDDLRDLRNYATVRFNPGAATGKTTWLHDVAGKTTCQTSLAYTTR